MTNWHGYLGIENLGLNAAQRGLLVDALKALGPENDPQPANLCHWRTRLDNAAAIFETLFDENHLTVEAFKRRLGTIFGVAWTTIGSALSWITFAERETPVVVFSRSGVDYLRMALFGGTGATWEQSRIEVLAYLAAHMEEWELGEDAGSTVPAGQ